MKITAVSDHFMKPEFYSDCFRKFPCLDPTETVFFGENDRARMRAVVDRIEKGGAYAVEPPAELFSAIGESEALMVHLCPVTEAVLDAAPKLKFVLSNRGGLENLDVEAIRRRGVRILHNPAHNGNAVAELTVALMICETRNVVRSHVALKNGVWREAYPNVNRVFELRHKTVGIIGFGTIGRLVAEKLQPFGVDIIACDPNVSPDDADLAKYSVRLTDLDTLMRESDIVTLHARTADRSLILGPRELDLMKPTATFINTARAYMVDYDHLALMLREKRITGAALEVFPKEPLPENSPFLELDNVTLTNHRGGDTVNCYSDSPEYLVRAMLDYVEKGVEPKYFI